MLLQFEARYYTHLAPGDRPCCWADASPACRLRFGRTDGDMPFAIMLLTYRCSGPLTTEEARSVAALLALRGKVLELVEIEARLRALEKAGSA